MGVLFSAILAGFCIGIGGTVSLSVTALFTVWGMGAFGSFIGASLFSIGLFTIIFFGLHLYTGKLGYVPFQMPGDTSTLKKRLADIGLVLLGNLAGTHLCGLLLTKKLEGTTLVSMVEGKLTAFFDSPLQTVILAFFCGVLMFVAVDGFKRAPVGKSVIVYLGVVVFILCGFEHSIADMFYIAAALPALELAQIGEAYLFLVVVVLGNAAGGIGFHGLYLLSRKLLAPAPVKVTPAEAAEDVKEEPVTEDAKEEPVAETVSQK